MVSLLDAFPDIAAQWDYERNDELTPADVSYGSNKIVWWKCSLCGHSYKKKIANRTAPAKRKTESEKCPICLPRINNIFVTLLKYNRYNVLMEN